MKRRNFLTLGAAGLVGGILPNSAKALDEETKSDNHRYQNGKSPWPICLDTATVRPASLEEKVEIADKAGFDAIEPWDGELQEYEEQGGDLKALGKEIKERAWLCQG
jgi:hypothetical protein